jgi:acetyl esterase/lipase
MARRIRRMKSYHVRRFLLLVGTLVAFAGGAGAQTDAPAEQSSTAAEWSDLLSSNYDALANITYRRANNTDLKLDLYIPHDRPKAVPVVLLIHGGGWVSGNKEGRSLDLAPYLQMGFAAVNVEYRLAANSIAPAAVEDCRCALHWVINNSTRYNFDVNRIVVTGGSAGGHLALTTGLLTPEAGFDRGCAPPDTMRWDKADNTVP